MADNQDWNKAKETMDEARYGEPRPEGDKRGWLKVFGGLMVFMGLVLLLLAYGMFDMAMNPPEPVDPDMPTGLAAGLGMFLVFGLPAALNIVLGWGSIAAKRWARALVRIFSGTGLVFTGAMVISMVLGVLLLPDHDVIGTGMGLGSAIAVGLFFGLPNLLVYWFYGRADVLATFERHDPNPSWTEKRPLIVVGITIINLVSTAGSLIGVVVTMFLPDSMAFPAVYFGFVVDGMAGDLTNIAIFSLYAYYTWLFWKLDLRGWWGLLALAGFYLLSTFVTQMILSPEDLAHIYEGMDPNIPLDEDTVQGMKATYGMMTGMSVLFMAGYVWLFLKVRKHFGLGGNAQA